jgi:hypothetical protein
MRVAVTVRWDHLRISRLEFANIVFTLVQARRLQDIPYSRARLVHSNALSCRCITY